MSGGGAKGIAHIGVIKALEENEIPIDYVVGTSMGGIVAGFYAAGWSPQQMEAVVTSEEFMGWISGKLDKGYNYYYNKHDDHPSFLKLNLSLDSASGLNLNSSLASDLSLNFAFAERMAQPTSICRGNFDSLMVPLRVVAADIFTQSKVILRRGSLSDAIRATHTVPFFYNPVKVDGKYLFDGGIYDNFPVDVMQTEFQPDIVIGSNVSSKVYDVYPTGQDEKLISKSLLFMLLDKSDPALVPTSGVYLQPNLQPFSAFDFARASELIDSGYQHTLRQIEEIKAKIARRTTCEAVFERRNQFANQNPPFVIHQVSFEGFSPRQQRYLGSFFRVRDQPLTLSQIKQGYYQIVSDDFFKNIHPQFTPSTLYQGFDFRLSRRPQNNFQIDFGGVMATRSLSGIFLGLNYYRFKQTLLHGNLNLFAGTFYRTAQIKARIDLPIAGQFYVEPEATFNDWSFLEGKDIIFKKTIPTALDRIDRKIGITAGRPMGRKYKLSAGFHYLNNTDRYSNTETFLSSDTLDRLKLTGIRTGVAIQTNDLNRKQYPNQGKAFLFQADYFDMEENLTPGSTSILAGESINRRSWIRARLTVEQYFRRGVYSSGYLVDLVVSNQPTFSNYLGSVINAPGFYPMQDSRTLLLPRFRSYNFAAIGWRNVFTIRQNLDLRLEGYVYKPLQRIANGPLQDAQISNDLSQIYLAGMASVVFHSTVGPISLSMNYYDDKNNPLGVLAHVGFMLYQKTSTE
ncbi:MAG: patatin-like phospholipase family protein [Cyclobacteriaceae bacterium]